MQRRTSMVTTWASSNPHSPELLVCYPDAAEPGSLTPQYRYVFVVPKVRCFCKARHCSRGGRGEGEYKANNELGRDQDSYRGRGPACSIHRGKARVHFPRGNSRPRLFGRAKLDMAAWNKIAERCSAGQPRA